MTFDAFSSSKRANIRNGLARALCAFGGALLWMALVPFGDEASAACPLWPVVGAVGDAKTITCTGTDHAEGAGVIDYPLVMAEGTLKLLAPLTVRAKDDDAVVVQVVSILAFPLTVEVAPEVVLETSVGAPGAQRDVLNVGSGGGKIVVRMNGEIKSGDSAPSVYGAASAGLLVTSFVTIDVDSPGDIEVFVGGEIEVAYRIALALIQGRKNGGINLEIDDGASLTSGSKAGGDDTPEGYSVVEAHIANPLNTKSLRVVIGSKVSLDKDIEDAKKGHQPKIHAVATAVDPDDDVTAVFQVPAIDLGHDGVGLDEQNQIDLQVFRGDLSAFGHGISAILSHKGSLGNIRIEFGSPGWRAVDDKPEIPSSAGVTITARSLDPSAVAADPAAVLPEDERGVGVYASHAGEGGVWILARYVDIDADMEGIRVDTTTAATKGVFIEIGHPGTETTKTPQLDGTTKTVRGTLASRSNVVSKAGHAVHVEYVGSKGAVEVSLFAGTIENQGHNAFTDDPSDHENGRGIHAHIKGWTLAGVDQPSINPDDIVIQVGSRKDSQDAASVDYYGAGIRTLYQSAIEAKHHGLGGIEIEVTIARDPVPDDDSFIGSIIGAEEAIYASLERDSNAKTIRIDIRGKPAVASTTSDDGTMIEGRNAVPAVFKTTGVTSHVILAVHKGVGEDPTDDTTGDSSIHISIKDSIIETGSVETPHGGADDPRSDAYETTAISSKAGIHAITRLATNTGSILVEVDGSRIKAGSPIHAVQNGLGMIAISVKDSSPGPSARDTKEGYDDTHYKNSQALGIYANDVFYDSAEPLLREVDILSNLVDDPLRQDALVSHPYVILNEGKAAKPEVEASNDVDAVAAVPATSAYRLKEPNFDKYGRGIHASLYFADNTEWIFVAVVNSRIEAQRNGAIRLVHRGVGSADATAGLDGAGRGDRVGDSIVLWIDGSVVKSRAPRGAGGDLSPPTYLGRPIYVEDKTGVRPNVEVTGHTPATWDSFDSAPTMNAIHAAVKNSENSGDLIITVYDSEIEADGSSIFAKHMGTGNIYVLVGKDDPTLAEDDRQGSAVGSVIRSVGNAIEVQHLGGAADVAVAVSGGSDIFTDQGTGIHVHETSEKPLRRIDVKVAGVEGDRAKIYVGEKRSGSDVRSTDGIDVLMEETGTGTIDIDIEYADIKTFLNDEVGYRRGVSAFHQGSGGTVDISFKDSNILSWGEAVQVYAASQYLMRNMLSEDKYDVDLTVTAVDSEFFSGEGSSSVAVYQFGEGDVSIDVESSAFYAGYGAYKDARGTSEYDAAALSSEGASEDQPEYTLVTPVIVDATIFSEKNPNVVEVLVKGSLLYSKFSDVGSDVAYGVDDTTGAIQAETKYDAIGGDQLMEKQDWSYTLSPRKYPVDAADKKSALSYLGARGQGILASHFGVDDPNVDDDDPGGVSVLVQNTDIAMDVGHGIFATLGYNPLKPETAYSSENKADLRISVTDEGEPSPGAEDGSSITTIRRGSGIFTLRTGSGDTLISSTAKIVTPVASMARSIDGVDGVPDRARSIDGDDGILDRLKKLPDYLDTTTGENTDKTPHNTGWGATSSMFGIVSIHYGSGDTTIVSKGDITTSAAGAHGIVAYYPHGADGEEGSLEDAGTARVIVESGTVSTKASGAHGIYVRAREATVEVKSGTIRTTASGTHGIYVGADKEAKVTVESGTIETTASGAHGIYVGAEKASVIVESGTVLATDPDAHGIYIRADEEAYVQIGQLRASISAESASAGDLSAQADDPSGARAEVRGGLPGKTGRAVYFESGSKLVIGYNGYASCRCEVSSTEAGKTVIESKDGALEIEVEEGGVMEGDIVGYKKATIKGTVRGNLITEKTVKAVVDIGSTAKVKGKIQGAESVMIRSGAKFEGVITKVTELTIEKGVDTSGASISEDVSVTIAGKTPSEDTVHEISEPLVGGKDSTWELNPTTKMWDIGKAWSPRSRVYEVLPQVLMSLNALPTHQERVGGYLNALNRSGLWVRVGVAKESRKPKTSTTGVGSYRQNQSRLQFGANTLASGREDRDLVIAGASFHRVQGDTSLEGPTGKQDGGSIKVGGYGLGVHGTWYGRKGFYVDGQGAFTSYESSLASERQGSLQGGGRQGASDGAIKGSGYAFSVEAGKRIEIRSGAFSASKGLTITPHAQFSYSSLSLKDYADKYGTVVSEGKGEELTGLLGFTLVRDASWRGADGSHFHSSLYGLWAISHNFDSRSEISLGGRGVVTEKVKFVSDEGRLLFNLGASYSWNDGSYVLFGELNGKTALRNISDNHTVGLNFGMRISF